MNGVKSHPDFELLDLDATPSTFLCTTLSGRDHDAEIAAAGRMGGAYLWLSWLPELSLVKPQEPSSVNVKLSDDSLLYGWKVNCEDVVSCCQRL